MRNIRNAFLETLDFLGGHRKSELVDRNTDVMDELGVEVVLRDHEIEEIVYLLVGGGARVHDNRENGTNFEAVIDLESSNNKHVLSHFVGAGRFKFDSSQP